MNVLGADDEESLGSIQSKGSLEDANPNSTKNSKKRATNNADNIFQRPVNFSSQRKRSQSTDYQLQRKFGALSNSKSKQNEELQGKAFGQDEDQLKLFQKYKKKMNQLNEVLEVQHNIMQEGSADHPRDKKGLAEWSKKKLIPNCGMDEESGVQKVPSAISELSNEDGETTQGYELSLNGKQFFGTQSPRFRGDEKSQKSKAISNGSKDSPSVQNILGKINEDPLSQIEEGAPKSHSSDSSGDNFFGSMADIRRDLRTSETKANDKNARFKSQYQPRAAMNRLAQRPPAGPAVGKQSPGGKKRKSSAHGIDPTEPARKGSDRSISTFAAKDKDKDKDSEKKKECECHSSFPNCFCKERMRMQLEFFKKETKTLKQTLKNTQIFLNMVIHDLRNPTTQINEAIKYALTRMEEAEEIRKDNRIRLIDGVRQASTELGRLTSEFKEVIVNETMSAKEKDVVQRSQVDNQIENLSLLLSKRDEMISILKQKIITLEKTHLGAGHSSISNLDGELSTRSLLQGEIKCAQHSLQFVQRIFDQQKIHEVEKDSVVSKYRQLVNDADAYQVRLTDEEFFDDANIANANLSSEESESAASEDSISDKQIRELMLPPTNLVRLSQRYEELSINNSKFLRSKQNSGMIEHIEGEESQHTSYLHLREETKSDAGDHDQLPQCHFDPFCKEALKTENHHLIKSELHSSSAIIQLDANLRDMFGENSEIENISDARPRGVNILSNLKLDDKVEKRQALIEKFDEFQESIEGIASFVEDSTREFEDTRMEIELMHDEYQEMLETSKHSSIMLLTLINDLLDLAKQQKLTFQLNNGYFNLKEAVVSTFKTLDFMATQKGITTQLEIEADKEQYFEQIYGDENRYEQILLNFISNALKFTNNKGTVTVKLNTKIFEPGDPETTQHRLKLKKQNPVLFKVMEKDEMAKINQFSLSIIDDGQGIGPDDLKNLFMDFGCLQQHKSSNPRGTGLGLSICKKIIHKMGGNVNVESELGKGTTFKIEITTLSKELVIEEEADEEDNQSPMPEMNEDSSSDEAPKNAGRDNDKKLHADIFRQFNAFSLDKDTDSEAPGLDKNISFSGVGLSPEKESIQSVGFGSELGSPTTEGFKGNGGLFSQLSFKESTGSRKNLRVKVKESRDQIDPLNNLKKKNLRPTDLDSPLFNKTKFNLRPQIGSTTSSQMKQVNIFNTSNKVSTVDSVRDSQKDSVRDSEESGLPRFGATRQDSLKIRTHLKKASLESGPFMQEDLKVLLVNDEFSLLHFMETVFKITLGIKTGNIQKANDGLQAYNTAIENDFDLIIMDLNMPVMSGFESTKKIKDHFLDPSNMLEGGYAKTIPYIVAVSAEEFDDELKKKCKEHQFDDQMVQPLTKEKLQKKIIDKLLFQKQLRGFTSPTSEPQDLV